MPTKKFGHGCFILIDEARTTPSPRAGAMSEPSISSAQAGCTRPPHVRAARLLGEADIVFHMLWFPRRSLLSSRGEKVAVGRLGATRRAALSSQAARRCSAPLRVVVRLRAATRCSWPRPRGDSLPDRESIQVRWSAHTARRQRGSEGFPDSPRHFAQRGVPPARRRDEALRWSRRCAPGHRGAYMPRGRRAHQE